MKSLISTLKYSFFTLLLLVVLTNCEKSSDTPGTIAGDNGQGGSLARFAFIGNNMYVVNSKKLKTYNVTDPANPQLVSEINVGESVETIFPMENKLFIGSQGGMIIYEIRENGEPALVSSYEHVTSCDPVVANQDYAYVTLNSGTQCRQWSDLNLLDIISLQDITHPTLVQSYQLESPLGLGLDGNILFVCEEGFGLKVFDVSNPNNIELLKTMSEYHARDVIILENKKLLLLTPENIIQLDYQNLEDIKKLSEIPVQV